MKSFFPIVPPALLLLCAIVSCGPDGAPSQQEPDTLAIAGIARTFDNGIIAEDDAADWQPRLSAGFSPSGNGLAAFVPVYPNPISAKGAFQFIVAEPADVRIVVVNVLRDTVATVFNRQLSAAGTYTIAWQPSELPPALYRAYYSIRSVADPSKHVESYGDIQIVR